MHIAVYDDNYVDRNQMNRLLTRASDENKKNGLEGYFIDLFGNLESLNHNIAMYDAIFLDVVNEEPFGHEIADRIFSLGVHGKIILCNSKIRYDSELSDDIAKRYLFIDKPIKTDELRTILDICDELRHNREPKIEIRSDTETFYVKCDDFYYAEVKDTGKITATLSDNRQVTFLGDINTFKKDVSIFDEIISINSKALINSKHIKEIKSLKLTMDDTKQFTISITQLPKVRKKIP